MPGAPAEHGAGEGYEHFTDVRRLDGKVLTVKAEKDGETLTLTAPLDGAEAFFARSPGNPSGKLRDTFVLRRRGTCVRFDVRFGK